MTDDVDPTLAPLSIEADLTLAIDDREASVRSTGDRLFVEFPSLFSALEALSDLPMTDPRALYEVLTATGLALEVRARHRTLVAIGPGVKAGALSKQLGMAPAQIRVCGFLSAFGAGASATVERVRSLYRA